MVEKSDQIPPGIPKDYRKVLELAREQGFMFGKARGGHPMVYPPDPRVRPIPIPTTPGNQRLLAGFIAQLRRGGLRDRT